jgi:hypothetical protein
MRVWRGRASGLARPPRPAGAALALSLGVLAVLGATAAGVSGPPAAEWLLVGRLQAGAVVFSVPLPEGSFALRYRNSVYGSLAEERFTVDAAGRLVLTELASDEVALLGEYYAVAQRPRPAPPADARAWVAPPAGQMELGELSLVASRHGERTLLVDGRAPIQLWDLAGTDSAALRLSAEKAP